MLSWKRGWSFNFYFFRDKRWWTWTGCFRYCTFRYTWQSRGPHVLINTWHNSGFNPKRSGGFNPKRGSGFYPRRRLVHVFTNSFKSQQISEIFLPTLLLNFNLIEGFRVHLQPITIVQDKPLTITKLQNSSTWIINSQLSNICVYNVVKILHNIFFTLTNLKLLLN